MEAKYIVFFILISILIIRAEDISDRSSKRGDLETIIGNPKEFNDRLLVLKYNNNFFDAAIAVVNIMIPVHKIILASSSEYFEKVFTENESRAEIELFDMDIEIAQLLIEYCYTRIISVSDKNLRKIMSAATFLKITPVIEGCQKILEEKMDFSKGISSWKFARSEHNEDLKNRAFEYNRQNYEKISHSPEFLDLDYSEILELLKSDIVVNSEAIVLNSVKKWKNYDSASRIQYLDELSNFIKFENIPKNILLSESHDFCTNNSSYKCQAKFLNVLQLKKKNNFESADDSFRDSYSTLMAVGSYYRSDSNTFEIFDLRNEKWIKIDFKCDRAQYSVVLLGHKLMLIGGFNGTTVNTVQSYDLNTGAIENMPPMKYAREDLTAVEYNGCVYAIGGFFQYTALSYVEMWDPDMKNWKELSPMSKSRFWCSAVVLDEEILVVGGLGEEGFLSDVESYNPVTNKWRKRASMNEKRSAFEMAVVNGYLYAVGGRLSLYGYSNTAERYDPKIDKWTTIHSLNITKHGMGAASLFGKLVTVGGYSNDLSTELSEMEMYDDENDNWVSGYPSLNYPRFFFNAVKVPWKLAKTTLSREVPK